jgi:hypothetical protein
VQYARVSASSAVWRNALVTSESLSKGKRPSFSHHAIALLAQHRLIRRTCLTTDFDKLIDTAFAVLGALECQAVRTDDELRFLHADPEKAYVVKLHGDNDTNNFLNTEDNTVKISQLFQDLVAQHLRCSGLIMTETAEWEKSISSLFEEVERQAESATRLPKLGLYWGCLPKWVVAPTELLMDLLVPQDPTQHQREAWWHEPGYPENEEIPTAEGCTRGVLSPLGHG